MELLDHFTQEEINLFAKYKIKEEEIDYEANIEVYPLTSENIKKVFFDECPQIWLSYAKEETVKKYGRKDKKTNPENLLFDDIDWNNLLAADNAAELVNSLNLHYYDTYGCEFLEVDENNNLRITANFENDYIFDYILEDVENGEYTIEEMRDIIEEAKEEDYKIKLRNEE